MQLLPINQFDLDQIKSIFRFVGEVTGFFCAGLKVVIFNL